MQTAIEQAGAPAERRHKTGFPTLLRIIVDQQVSVQAGAAIWRKLDQNLGGVSAKRILAAGEGDLRACGLSRAKAVYALALAEAVSLRALNLSSLHRMEDDSVREILMTIKGIGRWTADIYLMFALGRGDVWPAGDLALAEAAKRLLELPERPSPTEMDSIGERWKPWRTAAAITLWHYYKKVPITV